MARLREKFKTDAKGRKVFQGWMAEFYDPLRQPRLRRFSLATRDAQVARHKLTEYERKQAAGLWDPWDDAPDQDNATLTEAVKRFLKSREGLRQKTLDNYRSILEMFAKSQPGTLPVASVDSRMVERFLSSCPGRKGRDDRPKGLSKRSRQTYLTHLAAFFSWARKSGYMKYDPLPGKTRRREQKTVPHFLSREQLATLLRAIEADTALKPYSLRLGNAWLSNVIRFAVGTGLRRGELINLRWSAVDLRHGYVNVRNIADREDVEDFTTKSGQERSVPLVGDALEVVRYLNEQRTSEVDGYVFTGAKGGQVNERLLTRRFAYYRELAKMPADIHFHSLRHTFASWYVMGGGDLYRLKEIMGHANIQTTMIYAHLRPDTLREDMLKVFQTEEKPELSGDAELLQEVERLRAELARLQGGVILGKN